MREIGIEISVSWLNHSPWTEKYVGLRKLSIESLPHKIHEMEAEHSTVCHSIIVGSNQLIEMAFFDITSTYIGKELTKKDHGSTFHDGIKTLPKKIMGKSLNLQTEPYLSMNKLRIRRNRTIHKTVALADVDMARSALYTAVETVKAIYTFFEKPFPYNLCLETYPLEHGILFSYITYPEDRTKQQLMRSE
jgi:hypothetical protein